MQKQLDGKVALITGATKGLGLAYAKALASEGANIVVVARNQQACEETAAMLHNTYGIEALACSADVLQMDDIEKMVSKTVSYFGRIDILVNNAGRAITEKAEKLTEEEFDSILNLNLRSCFFVAQAVGRQMISQNSGKIINIGSILANQAEKQVLPYAVSKAAILQMTKALALEWARYNIQVNTLSPGYVMTDLNQNIDEKIRAHHMKRIALRRYASAEELNKAIVFLASDGSDYMTGQQLLIDGGWCAG